MKILSVIGPKGGGGKSTTVRTIAAAAAQGGLMSVTVFDTDPQNTAHRWGQVRSGDTTLAPITVRSVPIDEAPDSISGESGDFLIIDTPTALEEHPDAFKRLILASSFVLIPARPSLDDVASVAPFGRLVGDMRRDVAFALNAVKPRVAETDGARRYLSRYADVLAAALPDSVDIQRAMAKGRGITEHGGRGAEAAGSLWAELRRRLRLGDAP